MPSLLADVNELDVASYVPFAKQQAFHSSPARYRLFGGAAGPGKSRCLVEEAHQTCLEVANSDSLLLRRTFKELEASLLNKFERDIPYKQLGIRYNRGEHVAHYPNGARLIFGYCLEAGTLIDTLRGLVPIEKVTTVDQVLTRKGFRRVLWSGQSGTKPVVRFGPLGITGEHEAWTLEQGFLPVSSIMGIGGVPECQKDSIQTAHLLIRKSSFLKALSIAGIPTPAILLHENISKDGEQGEKRIFTSPSMKASSDLFLLDSRFITKMECSPIRSMAATTSSSHGASTANYISRERYPERKSDAQLAGEISSPFPTKHHDTALSAAAVPVFDLAIEGEHEFFANGILVHNCRRENDVYQYQGGAYVFIGIDELTLFTLKMWQFLSSRNRADGRLYTAGPNKGLPAFASMAGASNPGNIGHQFVKALFVDKRPAPGMEHPERYHHEDYDFIRARIEDNPILMADTEYLEKLRDLPETLRKAFLDGDWNIFAGQYFDIFQRGEHTAPPEELKRKPWYPCWISIDWGFGHPAAVYWHWQESERTVTYREFVTHRPGEVGKGLTPRALALSIVERMPRDKDGKLAEKIHEIDLSAEAIDDKHSWGENSVAELMDDVFLDAGLPPCTHADNDRVGGWTLMYQLLKNGCWVISEDCERLIETLPMMTRDPDKLEDCLKVDGDDPPDAARYGLKTKLNPRNKPVDVRVAERVEALKITGNPTAEMMMAHKIYTEEKKKFKPRRMFGPRLGGFRH